MKKLIYSILAIFILVSTFGVISMATESAAQTYTMNGAFDGAKEGDRVTIFVLKDDVTMESLKTVSGSIMDKVYLIDETVIKADGTFEYKIKVKPEALDRQCVITCNGVRQQDTLRNFIKGETIKLVYAAPNGKSSTNGGEGTIEKPFGLTSALTKAKSYVNEGYSVDICLLGGTYTMNNSRVQIIDVNTDPDSNARITYRPATENDKVVFSGMKRIPSEKFVKVTDNAILSRIPENARKNIYSVDLTAAGIDAEQLSFNYAGETADQRSINPPAFYLNGKRQRISQYPNESYFTTGKNSTGKNSNGNPQLNVSALSQIDVSKWVASKDNAYLTGFLFESYRAGAAKILDINTTSKKLTIDGTKEFFYETDGDWLSGYTYYGPRVTIVNLIEEMDIPGEWCLDQATNTLYYFAPHELTADDVFEMPHKSSTYPQIVFVQRSNRITFKNIEFKGTRTHVGVYISDTSDVQLIDCDIHATGKAGVSASGKNTVIDGCNIYDIGTAGVIISGNMPVRDDVSVPSNNVVSNNHIYDFSQNPTFGSDGQGVCINRGSSSNSKTLSDTVENNVIHRSKFIGAVRYGGLDIEIKRNEMYNLLDSVDDAGVVYTGRTFNEFGNRVVENYIHDYSVISKARYSNMGIYWDDHISGQTAERNIIVSNNKSTLLGIRTIGYANVIKNNTFVDSYYAMRLGDRGTVDFAASDSYNLYSSLTVLPNEEFEYYDDMVAFKAALDANNKKMVYKATAEKNLTVNSKNPVNYSTTYYNKAETEIGNVTADASIFVDAASQNYIVKASEAKEGTAFAEVPNENNFSMDLIGVQKVVPFVDDEFKLMYPANNAEIAAANVVLTWEKANYADRYDYVVATDSEFSDVVLQGSTEENFIIPKDTLANGTYYWKVTAVNTSATFGKEWNNENGVMTFTVGEGMPADIISAQLKSGESVVTSLNGVKDFTVDYTVYNNTKTAENFVAVAALYNGKDQLMNVTMSDTVKTVVAGGVEQGTINITNEAAISEDGWYVKVFVLEDIGNVAPLSYVKELLR